MAREDVTGFTAPKRPKDVTLTAHKCLDCGRLVFLLHPGPHATQERIAERGYTTPYHLRRQAREPEAVPRSQVWRVLDLLRALRRGEAVA